MWVSPSPAVHGIHLGCSPCKTIFREGRVRLLLRWPTKRLSGWLKPRNLIRCGHDLCNGMASIISYYSIVFHMISSTATLAFHGRSDISIFFSSFDESKDDPVTCPAIPCLQVEWTHWSEVADSEAVPPSSLGDWILSNHRDVKRDVVDPNGSRWICEFILIMIQSHAVLICSQYEFFQ